jgi:N-acetylmuramoyl-L-alanine amidase
MHIRNTIALLITAVIVQAESPTLTDEQTVVAKTLLGEARGEGYEGMYAVACVIAQRTVNKHMGAATAKDTCLKNNGKVWQYSCWNPSDPNFKKLNHLLNTHPLAGKAKALAVHLHALDRSYVKNADHYAHKNVTNYWTIKLKHVATVGDHKFYRKGK